jgi:ribosomal protein L11 methyltransferase
MPLSEFISLAFEISLEYEEILKGYFLMNHDVQGFEETSAGLLTVYLLHADWSEVKLLAVQEFLATLPVKEVKLVESELIEEKDWNAAWEAEIEPVKISDELVISPSWKLEDAKKLNAKYQIIIDPKMSFGTGHHETTRLCLQTIEHLDCKNKSVLDIGTGTGALGMYALLRGTKYAIGIDTDHWSYENVIENRERNSFSEDQFEVRLGDLAATVKISEHFDIILANIHRNILLVIRPDIKAHHKSGGSLILSGILEYDAAEVLEAYQKTGYMLIEQMQENEWIALHLELNK